MSISANLEYRAGDYLCTHGEVRDEYARLKKSLAEKFPYDIDAYCDGKDAFVKDLERKALAQCHMQKLN